MPVYQNFSIGKTCILFFLRKRKELQIENHYWIYIDVLLDILQEGNSSRRILIIFTLLLCLVSQQLKRTVLSCTNLVRNSAEFTQSTLMVQEPLMCSVTKKRPVGGGQCSKRDWTARLISTVAGMITSVALVT